MSGDWGVIKLENLPKRNKNPENPFQKFSKLNANVFLISRSTASKRSYAKFSAKLNLFLKCLLLTLNK